MFLIVDVVLAMVLIVNVVLAMVLIADVLALLIMIAQPERKPTTAIAMAMPKQQSHTVSDVAAEHGPANNDSHNLKMGQQATRPWRTPGTLQ